MKLGLVESDSGVAIGFCVLSLELDNGKLGKFFHCSICRDYLTVGEGVAFVSLLTAGNKSITEGGVCRLDW